MKHAQMILDEGLERRSRMGPSTLKHAEIENDDGVDCMVDEEAIASLVRSGAVVEEEDAQRVVFSNVSEHDLVIAREASAIRQTY